MLCPTKLAYICPVAKALRCHAERNDYHTKHSAYEPFMLALRRSSRYIHASNCWHQLHADVWADWVKFFESRIQLSAIADGRWTATGLSPLFSNHRLFLRVLHPQTPHKVSDLDQKDAERILLRSRTR